MQPPSRDAGRSLPHSLSSPKTFGSLLARQGEIQVPLNWIQGKQNHAPSLFWIHHVGLMQAWGLSPLLHRTLSCCTELRKQCNRPQGRVIFDVHNTVNCMEFGEGKAKKASPTETISSFTVLFTL